MKKYKYKKTINKEKCLKNLEHARIDMQKSKIALKSIATNSTKMSKN